jgi:hypothetical protein
MDYKEFGSTREVFVNQDEGMFVALPITFDESVLSLETEVRNGRTYVKAGSLVLQLSEVKGITAEEYDITYGPVVGRVVVEGYAWKSRLTDLAVEGAALLPRIVLLPLEIDGSASPSIPSYFKLDLTGAPGVVSDADDEDNIKEGSTVILTVTIPEGKQVDVFTVNGVSKTFTDNKYTHIMNADTTVVVTFKDEVAGGSGGDQ